jgi:prepilin peptidase CpaA
MDYSKMLIPNWITLVLIALFFLWIVLTGGVANIGSHLSVAGGVFILGLIFNQLGWFGGGDVKFLTAVMLWAGTAHAANLVFLIAVFGTILAFLFLALRKIGHNYPAFKLPILSRFQIMAGDGVVPYGIPIGLATLIYAPQLFY